MSRTTQGMRTPFYMLETMDSYDFYCAMCFMMRKTLRTRTQFKADNFKIFERAQSKLKELTKKAKKYKCYV